jgi:hypothetical protein
MPNLWNNVRRCQRPQVRLDRVDAEEDLVGDRLVRRGHRIRIVASVRAAQRNEHPPLSVREVSATRRRARPRGCLAAVEAGLAERDGSRADHDHVAVLQAVTAAQPVAVDVRPVARQPIVVDRPCPTHALQHRVDTRNLLVPIEGDVVLRPAPDRDRVSRCVESADQLAALGVAIDQERPTRPLGFESLLELDRRGAVRRQR